MAARPTWKGYLKLSLVSCPVALYNATTTAEKVAFHLLHRETGNRLRRQMVDPETDEVVGTDDTIRGYEVAKGEHVTLESDEIDAVAIESSHTIDVDQFVARDQVSDIYLNAPYYLVPNDKIGEEAFAVIREAMRKRKMAGVARVVLNRREHVVLLEPHGRGIVATTLRYPYEIKPAAEVFGGIGDVDVPEEMLDLAEHILDRKTTVFRPETFEDRYENALIGLIRSKQAGTTMKKSPSQAGGGNVIDLMEALRRSVAGTLPATAPRKTKAGKAAAAPQEVLAVKKARAASANVPPKARGASARKEAALAKLPAR